MPRTKNVGTNAPTVDNTKTKTTTKKPTANEMQRVYKEQRRQELFANAQKVMQLLDLTKTKSRTYTVYSKENLRSYMQNPTSNENRLRNLSRFLYRMSQPYRRLLQYNAQQVDLTAMTLTPNIDVTQDNDTDKVLKDYYDTSVQLEKMHLHSEIYKLLLTAWIEDTAYGYIYEDNDGFFIYPLDGEYCQVSSIQSDAHGTVMNMAFDFSYFRSKKELLEYWDSEFKTKYEAYQSDQNLRWQELDPERTIVLKVGIDDPTLSIPPYCGLLESVIDNVDLQSIVSVKDELSIYKLLVARLEHMSGSDDPDDFEINVDVGLDYYNKLVAALPECVDAILSPMPIEPIEFKGTTTDDTDMIANSMSNLFKVSGGSMVLNDEHTGSTIYRAHMIADMETALKPLLGEIEAWVNRYLQYKLSNPSIVHYIETSPWMKNEKKNELIQSAQYGVPVKTAVAALDGYSPLEVLRMQYLENNVLNLHNEWIPLQSSYTQSSDNTNEKDITELTDEGAESREKEKNEA